jgi:hypothetical protein
VSKESLFKKNQFCRRIKVKKLLLTLIIGIVLAMAGNVYAYPSTVTIECDFANGKDCSVGETLFFEMNANPYQIEIMDGAIGTFTVQGQNLNGLGWLWGMNINQPSESTDFILGDYLFNGRNASDDAVYYVGDPGIPDEAAAKNDALTNDAGTASFKDSVLISVTDPGGEFITFYVDDPNPRDNQGSLTVEVSVVPEPISSVLFVIGGSTLAARRYFRRKK